eukprot:c5802_g1_i1.p1 GENE.c5802_g1_i1~~c5802_g1_i1.p1  ORF type:complete len:426 (-),score=122.64 c5802_g1_i1:68-1312(-)
MSANTFQAQALIADNTSGIIRNGTIERRNPLPKDILIKVMYCGICHSDLHQIRGEWNQDVYYPMVPGHEVVGIVQEIGAQVTKFKIGDKVGVGCMVDSCRECDFCKAGDEQYCQGKPTSKDGTLYSYNCCAKDPSNIHIHNSPSGEVLHGGYSSHLTCDEDFVLRVPDSIPFERAGPLLCAGITTYSPLVYYGKILSAVNGRAQLSVGVAGLGGLGHMAVKIAKKLGHTVTVLSRSQRKRDAALAMGADVFCDTADKADLAKNSKSIDLIINTISATFATEPYMGLLKTNGVMCLVGLPSTHLEITPGDVVFKRRSLAGSLIGGIRETQEMLDFCAKHSVYPDVELIEAKDLNHKLYELSQNATESSRFVIRIDTLTPETVVEAEPKIDPKNWHPHPKARFHPAEANVHAHSHK